MAFYSYLNMGVYYSGENNFFNAIQANEIAITREHRLLSGLNNIAGILKNIGMQKEALIKLNRSISYYESGRREKDYGVWVAYTNRAGLLRILGNESEMQIDIQKSFQIKPNFTNSWIEIGKNYVKNMEFEKAENAFSMAINSDKSKLNVWTLRGKFYELIGQYEKAIADFSRANELSTKKKITLFNLGKAYYLSGNFQKANDCYIQCLKKGENFQQYSDAFFQFGIVLHIDKANGFGFILGQTFFNHYDKIYFKLSDAKTIPVKGARVKFKCCYQVHNMQYAASAKFISIDNTISEAKFRNHRVYHAIISVKQNAFRSFDDCKYIEVFYPQRTILSFSSVEDKLDNETIIQLDKTGYSFVELVMNISENNIVELDYLKPINLNNTYNNKVVSKGRSLRGFSSRFTSGKTCYVCGMNEWCGTGGCPGDPT
jgi:tetratricopeptide (TPR) repeat protein